MITPKEWELLARETKKAFRDFQGFGPGFQIEKIEQPKRKIKILFNNIVRPTNGHEKERV